MDNTYKPNKEIPSLLEVVNMMSTKLTFVVAFTYILH